MTFPYLPFALMVFLTILKSSEELQTALNGKFSNISLHESLLVPANKWKNINCECGSPTEDVGTRKLGSFTFKSGELPWIVGITASKKGQHYRDRKHLCSGSLISASYVITSAQCVTGLPKAILKVELIGNTVNRTDKPFYNVDRVKFPPWYRNGIDHGIALLKLQSPVNLARTKAIPICLPSALERHTNASLSLGSAIKPLKLTDILVRRWMYRKIQGEKYFPVYAQLETVALNSKNCSNIYPELLKRKTICIKGAASASAFKQYQQAFLCFGEPGLSLMKEFSITTIKNGKNKQKIEHVETKYFLTGLSSRLSGCRRESDSEEHTNALYNIIEYESWIRENSYDGSYCRN